MWSKSLVNRPARGRLSFASGYNKSFFGGDFVVQPLPGKRSNENSSGRAFLQHARDG